MFRAIFARLLERMAGADRTVKKLPPEAARIRDALDMHALGVSLYRQRMHREHPRANRDEINDLVRAWLISPPQSRQLRLPSRERDRGIG
jgi:hypothetical protein